MGVIEQPDLLPPLLYSGSLLKIGVLFGIVFQRSRFCLVVAFREPFPSGESAHMPVFLPNVIGWAGALWSIVLFMAFWYLLSAWNEQRWSVGALKF
jgi:hypothetical protein